MSLSLAQIIEQRRSVRAFLDKRVEQGIIQQICLDARRAPSGANLQPGAFHILTGDALSDFTTRLSEVAASELPAKPEYSYFPDRLSTELKSRQRAAGYALYHALGIERRDLEGRKAQFLKNYRFFDAPVGVVVTIDREMGKGCFMDLGMALMGFFLSAQANGLATTGIGALANYAPTAHQLLGLPEDEMIVCGIALGYADPDASENQVRTERAALDDYAQFYGFDD